MGRRLAAAALLVACGGLIAVVSSTTSQAITAAPEKTAPPAPGPATTTTVAGVPTVTLWPSTTVSGSTTTTLPGPATTLANTSTSTSFAPQTTTGPASTTFDAFALLRDFYGGLAVDPFETSTLADETAVPGSSAFAFLYHEVGVAGSIYTHTNAELPEYTVTANGPAVSVCRNDGACEVFSDFILAGGLLDTFSVDGQPIDQWTSEYERRTTAHALTVDASFAVRRPRDEVLSVVLLLSSAGGGTAFGWEQASYVDGSGRPFPIDMVNSHVPRFVEDGGSDLAHVSFADALHGGQLTVPFTADSTGVATTIRIPVVLRSGAGAAGFAPSATAVPTTVAGAPVFEPVDFFTDFFAQINEDPHEPGDLPQRVVAGSPADAFVSYLLGFGAARLDSRQGPLSPFTVTATTTAIEGSEAVEVCNDGSCDTFSDFVVADGRLQSFLLNGLAIDDRLASPSKSTIFGPLGIRVVGAFERVTVDELAIVVGLESADELTVRWDEVSYVDPSGRAIPVDLPASAYPAVITPRADKRDQAVVLQFPSAELGGDVVLTFTSGSSTSPVEARLPVEELRP